MGIIYSEREISSIGQWLSINGHFKSNWKLWLHWFVIFAFHLAIYLFFVYELFMEIAFNQFTAIFLNIKEESVKEETKFLTCNF